MSFYRINHPNFTIDDMMQKENQISVNQCNDEDVREGLSACHSREELACYLAASGIEFRDNWVLVKFEGTLSHMVDSDAELGAVLVFPTRILSTETIGDGFVDEIFGAHEQLCA